MLMNFSSLPFLWLVLISFTVLVQACKTETKPDSIMIPNQVESQGNAKLDYDTTHWKEFKAEDGYVIDIKYATTDNFVKVVIYPCGRFFLRPEVARALDEVKKEMEPQGYKLKLFDGYRPRPAQQILWNKVPNPDYVAPPAEGSMHNRGVAIDLTITDMNGKEIDMGTHYDFFGPEAHQDYTNLPEAVLWNRLKLKSAMEAHGFQPIRTEWWHFSYSKGSYPLDDWQWPCNQ
jgi:D-alanyl-D-alanine dipeptidase